MCGRYYIEDGAMESMDLSVLNREALGQQDSSGDMTPGMSVPALVHGGEATEARRLSWGFTGAGSGLVINARFETLRDRPMFSGLADRQRCALPASGYYEWRRSDHQKYAVSLSDRGLIFLAGLYRYGAAGLECVVLTQPPTPCIERIHNRMPLVLPDEAAMRAWLNGAERLYDDDTRLSIRAQGDEQLSMRF